MKIIFAGTPDFAAVALKKLIECGHEVSLVFTQPDRPSGRGMKLTPSPVKLEAQKHGIKVLTPQTLSIKRNAEEADAAYEAMKAENADLLVVAAYGLILPQRVLDVAKGIGRKRDIRSINIHASLLPRWRGAAPIARSIEAGDSESGVTLMKMELGLDTGPMIMKASTPILKDDTNETLTQKIAELGADLLVEALKTPYELDYEVQPEEGVCYAEKLLKSEGRVDWNEDADVIERRMRAFTPFPGLNFEKDGTVVKIWKVDVVEQQGRPGEVIEAKKRLIVACGSRALNLSVVQRPGKPKGEASALLQSMKFKVGEILS